MITNLQSLLAGMRRAARRQGLSDRAWATAAQLRPETLARLADRGDCDLRTLSGLANAVDMRISLPPQVERQLPTSFGRASEEVLLQLCVSASLDLRRWLDTGPRWFMAGVAVMVAGTRGADREGLLLLAEALAPGMSSVEEFGHWLAASPVAPARFLPMLEHRLHNRRSDVKAQPAEAVS